MFCDICRKHSATVHLTEIVNDKVVEMHICHICAKSKAKEFKEQFNISDFLGGLVDTRNPSAHTEEKTLSCNACGLVFESFRKKGRLGCGECYTAFKKQLLPLLKKIHTAVKHTGKSPLSSPALVAAARGGEITLQELKDKLADAIGAEEYEEAARLRDKISELEKKY